MLKKIIVLVAVSQGPASSRKDVWARLFSRAERQKAAMSSPASRALMWKSSSRLHVGELGDQVVVEDDGASGPR